MIIHIGNTTTVREVNTAIGSHFPFLKIEFFTKRHGEGEMSKRAEQLPEETLLGSFKKDGGRGDLILTKSMTVAEVEHAFEDHFGLHAQVFRKQGGTWIMTGITDTWTLEQQNLEGQTLSLPAED